MAWVYILRLNNQKYYIGSTTNIKQRIIDHQAGKSTYTSKFLPCKLVFQQKYPTYKQAYKIEKWLKSLKDSQITTQIIKDKKILKS